MVQSGAYEAIARTGLVDNQGQCVPTRPINSMLAHGGRPIELGVHNRTALSRNALPMTDTELRDIASAATTGLSRRPKEG